MAVTPEVDLAGQQSNLRQRNMRTATDSMVITYVIHAIRDSYDPAKDSDDMLRPERVAAFRLAVYEGLVVVPRVLDETKDIRDPESATWHDSLRHGLLYTVYPTSWERSKCIESLTGELIQHHPKRSDCRAVAEAQSLVLQHFITFDVRMMKRLAGRLSGIQIVAPSVLWEKLAIRRGTTPRSPPDRSNPMFYKKWWLADYEGPEETG